MKKRWKKILSVLMVGTVMVGSLTACGGDKEEKGGKSSDVKVAIICSSAGQNDNGYNQLYFDVHLPILLFANSFNQNCQ